MPHLFCQYVNLTAGAYVVTEETLPVAGAVRDPRAEQLENGPRSGRGFPESCGRSGSTWHNPQLRPPRVLGTAPESRGRCGPLAVAPSRPSLSCGALALR